MNDPDQAVTWTPRLDDDLPSGLSAYENSADIDDRPSSDPTTGLVSLGFIGTSLWRGRRLWCTLAVIGLLMGGGSYVFSPAAHKATVSVLLVDNPSQSPSDEVQTDLALAQSAPVAAAVVGQLGLQQTPTSFMGAYTVIAVTNQVLMITAGAANSDEAVRIATSVAQQFLRFRAQYAQTQQLLTETALNQQVSRAQQQLDSINEQINQITSQSSPSEEEGELNRLKTQREAASNALAQLQQYVTGTLASTRTATQAMAQGSEILNSAVAVKSSRLKGWATYAGGGLVGGFALGATIVIVAGITSSRLRRRDDIAHAIGSPVRLSVGSLRESRWLPRLGRRGAIRHRDRARFVEHLRNAVPAGSRGPAGLAVVAVDDAPTVARAVIALAIQSAERRQRVVVADLSSGAHAARLLGADSSGSSMVSKGGVRIMVVLPTHDDVAPVGPLWPHASPNGYGQDDQPVAADCANADLVLSLVTLDPALGGEHLSTWATDAVAVVTAGRSTVVRIHAVGEMIWLAGVRLSSVVVLDADKSDESLGIVNTAYQPAPL